jgi:iron complex outermembrane receptor protein
LKIKLLVTLLVVEVGVSNSFSQSVNSNCQSTVMGKVIDEHDRSDLSFAAIYIIENEIGVSANFEGEYKIENLCFGNYHIVISHIGCTPDTVEIEINSNLLLQNFELEHHAEELNEVQVASFKRDRHGVTSLEIKPIEKQEVMQSIASLASTVNGVNMLQNGANVSKPIIHGLHSNRVAIVTNGMTLEGQNWGEEHAPELDPFTIDQLKVVKGASALKYGSGAIGGALISSPKKLMDSTGINGLLFLGGSSNNRKGTGSLRLEGKFDKLSNFSWAMQGSLKKSGTIRTPNYYLNNTGTEEYNYSWQLGYEKNRLKTEIYYSQINTELGIFSGAHIGNLTDLEEAINRSEPREEDKGGFSYSVERPYQHVEHETIQWRTNYDLKAVGTLELQLARQFNIREEYDKHTSRGISTDQEELPEFAVNLETYQAQLGWQLPKMKQVETEIGGKFQTQKNVLKGSRSFIPAYDGTSFGGYLISNWKKNLWTVNGGFRIDNSSMNVTRYINKTYRDEIVAFTTLAGSLEADLLLSENWKVGLNTTIAQRAPGINELFSAGLHHGVAALEYGDANLDKETSYKVSGSVIYQTNKTTFDALIYSNLIDNFIYLQPDGTSLTVRGAFPVFRYQQVNALLNGLDLAWKYEWTNAISLNAKTSLLWAKNRSINQALIFMPANRIGGGINYQFKNVQKIHKPWIGLAVNHVFEQKRVPSGVDFTTPPNAYTLLQIKGGISLPIKNQKIELDITIDNVFNTTYRDYMNRFRYYADEMGRNISLSLKVPFTVMK